MELHIYSRVIVNVISFQDLSDWLARESVVAYRNQARNLNAFHNAHIGCPVKSKKPVVTDFLGIGNGCGDRI